MADLTAGLGLASVIPFIVLLLAIAILPLVRPHFWQADRNKALVCGLLASPIVFLLLRHHPAALVHAGSDYFSFIVLLGALFIISGGVLVRGDLRATPATNAAILVAGAVLANLIGTTGASMLLIRPLLRTNSERRNTAHLPVFFIFLVSNIGGSLTPLADPPLFLGYLRGVPFFWTFRLLGPWLTAVTLVLAVFLIIELRAYRQETGMALALDRAWIEPLGVDGKVSLLLLGPVAASLFFHSPIREIVMLGAAMVSYAITPAARRAQNRFTFHPISEVAIVFAGIFVTMTPALMLLERHAPELGLTEPWQFFWLTGAVSSFLDNAPSYLAFLSLAQGLDLPGEVIGVPARHLAAISLGAVFMGANSYIGNGPNFMVRTIAERSGVRTPSFFGYMLYAAVILLPIDLLICWLYLR